MRQNDIQEQKNIFILNKYQDVEIPNLVTKRQEISKTLDDMDEESDKLLAHFQ